jgi:hypothetical protein
LMNKHLPSHLAKLYLAWTNFNLNAGNVDVLDANLNLFRSLDRFRTH